MQNRLIKMCTSYICSVYFIITCIAKPSVSCLCYCMATGRSCTWYPRLQWAWWRLPLHWALIFIWRIRDEVTQHKTPTNARQQQGITTALLVDLRRTVPWSLAGLVRCGHRLWTEKRRADFSLGVVVYCCSQPRTGRGKLSAKPSELQN